MDTIVEIMNNPDLVRFLTKYGDGPSYLAEPSDEVIWRLVNYVRSARSALGLESPVSESQSPVER